MPTGDKSHKNSEAYHVSELSRVSGGLGHVKITPIKQKTSSPCKERGKMFDGVLDVSRQHISHWAGLFYPFTEKPGRLHVSSEAYSNIRPQSKLPWKWQLET